MIRAFLGFLGAEPEEDTQVLLLLGMGFFMGVFIASFEVGAEVLFLKTSGLGDSYLDYAFFTSGFLGIISTILFVYFQKRISFERLSIINLSLITLFLIALGLLFSFTDLGQTNDTFFKAVVFLAFVSFGPITAIMLLNFWGTFNRMFDLRQSKRIIGGVDTGQLTATIITFFAIALIPRRYYDTSNLIMVSAVSVTGVLGFLIAICYKYDLDNSVYLHRNALRAESKYSYLYKNKFLRLLSVFLILSMVATQFMDFTFLSTINIFYPDETELKTFIAFFLALVMIVSFLIQTFLNDWIIGTYGLRVALLIMPAILGLFIFGAIIAGSIFGYQDKTDDLIYFFLFVSLGRLFSAALKDALENPAFKLFFLPLDKRVRQDIQTKVEGVVNEFSSLLAGSLLIIMGTLSYFKLIHYSIFIIALVIALFWVTGRLYLQYRYTLQQALTRNKQQNKHAAVAETDIIKLLHSELATDDVDKVIYTLKLMERIEPFLLERLLVEMLESASGEATAYAVNRLHGVGNTRHLTLLEQLLAQASTAELKTLAREAIDQLTKIKAMGKASVEELGALARSTTAKDRILACQLLASLSKEEHIIFLSELLRDINPQVRKAALMAAGRNQAAECWPYLIRNLSSPVYSNIAAAAISAIGEPILLSLETAFNRTGVDTDTQIRIVQIYGRIGGEEAQALLWKKIDNNDQKVFSQVLISLSQMGYRAEDFQAARIKINIEQDIEDIVWNLSAIEHIPELPENELIREALLEENKHNFEHVYMLLAMNYDPESIAIVKENVESGITENITFALELLDVFLTEDLKPKLYPILDDITLSERIRKLDEYYPPELFRSEEDVYFKIINRDYNHINKWTKALALYRLGQMTELNVGMDLVANLFNPDPMLRQTAAWAIYQIDQERYEEYTCRLEKDKKRELDRVILPLRYVDEYSYQEMLHLERTLLLKQIDAFAVIPGLILSELALHVKEKKIAADTLLVEEGQGGDSPMYILKEGYAEVYKAGLLLAQIPALELIGESHVLDTDLNTASIKLPRETVVLLIDKDKFYELLSKNHEMISGIMQIMHKKFETHADNHVEEEVTV